MKKAATTIATGAVTGIIVYEYIKIRENVVEKVVKIKTVPEVQKK